VDFSESFWELKKLRKQSIDSKQGSSNEIIDDPELIKEVYNVIQDSKRVYKKMIDKGVAKEQARINVLNAWNQANDNIQNAMSKHLTTYINKVKYLNKTIKNLLGYQIKDIDKNLSKDFNLTEIQNYDILIKDNNNKSLDKIKNAMVLFLSKIENIKIQSIFKVNKAREEAMNDIQYKWNQYFASKKI
jgi:hypothetical protein